MKGVYVIRNKRTGFVYIGSSLLVETRIEEHFLQLKKGKHGNYRLQAAYKKDSSYFSWGVIEEFEESYVDREELYDREQYYLDTMEKQYNILRDARGHLIKSKKKRLKHNKNFRQRKLKL